MASFLRLRRVHAASRANAKRFSNIPSNIKEYQTGELQPLSAIPRPGDAGPSATSPFGSAGAEATDFSQFSVSALSRAMRLSISRGIAWKSPRSWRSFLPMVLAQSHSAIALPPKQTRQAAGECRPVDRVCGDLANKAKHTRWMALVSFPVAAKLWAARLSCLHACNLVKPLLMRCRSALREKRRPASAAAIYPRCGHRTEPLTERRVASMSTRPMSAVPMRPISVAQARNRGRRMAPAITPVAMRRRCAEQGSGSMWIECPRQTSKEPNLQGAPLRPNARAQPRLGNRAGTAAALGSMLRA